MAAKEKIEIAASVRKPGKGGCRKLRSNKNIPAVVYGPKIQPMAIYIEERDAVKYTKHGFENTIFTLKSDDKAVNGQQVLKKTFSVHPVSRRPVHIDFYALDMSRTVVVNVELNFVGKSEGEKNGGVFNAILRQVEIECLPIDIPDKFDVDISGIEMNGSLHVSDLNLGNYKVLSAPELTVCTVAEVKEEVVNPEEAAAAAAAALADPKEAAPAAAAGKPAAGKDDKKKE